MAAPTISQRIALEGADSIIAQLQTMGQAGQRALEQLSQAAQSSQSPLAGLSDRMNAAGKAVSDAGQKFSQLFADLRNNLPNIQQFAAIFGVTLAGGITGAAAALVDFASRAASSAAEVGRTAQQIGFGVEAYQAWKFAAAAAGLESDKFGVAMGRMARAVEEADKAQTKAAVSLADSLVKGLGQGGVVLQKVGDGFITMAGALGVTLDAAKGVGPKILQPVKLTAEQMDQLRLAASQVADVLAKGGLQITTDQLARKLLEMGSASEAARQQLRELGVDFPARTVEEAVRRVGDTSIDKFSKMSVAIKEVRDGGLQLRPMEDILADVADKFQKMPDGAQKTALAIELFGRSGRLLVPLLNEGKDGVQHLMEEFARLGVTLTGVQTKAGIEQVRAWHEFETAVAGARNQMGILFTGTVTEGLKAFTDLIRNNIPALKAWAAEMAGSVNQAVRDFISVLRGQQGPLQNDWLRTVFAGAQEVATLFTSTLPAAFGALREAAQSVADGLNRIFGTEISGGALLAVAAIGLMTGAFQTLGAILAALVPLVIAIGIAIAALDAPVLAIGALFVGLGVLVAAEWDGIKQSAAETVDWLSNRAWNEIVTGAQTAWNSVVGIVQSALSGMLEAVTSWVQGVISAISSIASAIANAFSGAAASGLPAGGGGENPSPFAGGGLVRGPGTTTSDSILAWLSDKEFVHNAASVAYYGVAFHRALNAMRIPREALFSALRGLHGFNLGGLIEVPRLASLSAFADGGLALAAPGAPASSRALTLVIDGKTFGGLSGSADAVDRLERFAIAQQARATGRSPSWRR
jgi:uncharacterized protein YukE